ncbi:MAG: RNA polymerase factor sigma-54 [Thermodesulfobacteriota bacterium]
MAFELKQSLKLSQSLVMTPQLQLAIKLLQMSRLDLIETVRDEMEQNPVLDESAPVDDGPQPEPEAEGSETSVAEWQNYLAEGGDYGTGSGNFVNRSNDDYDVFRNIASAEDGLQEYLLWQLNMAELDPEIKDLAEFIIGNIDDDGYLRVLERESMDDEAFESAVIAEISRCSRQPMDLVEEALSLIHGFEPSGSGARTARECLLIQARLLPERSHLAEEIITSHLKAFAARNIKAIARSLAVSEDEVRVAARLITSALNPTPGSGFGGSVARHIVPDVFIRKVGDEYVITLNDDGMPKLKISRQYRAMLAGESEVKGQDKSYLQERVRSAMWLIKSLHQRQRTIYRVVECIVDFQREFLDKGLKYLRPLVLKDVAAILGVHESTVSRVTSNKYVDTPRGLFELKYFFSSSIAGEDGGDVTSEYIKEKIGEIIEGEDAARPLSDQDIARLLGGSGIKVARRTVAKYREALGLPSSSRRKACF